MQVFLIRHPRPRTEAGTCYGQLDVDCEDPEPIAAALRPLLPPATVVVSSPLRRARVLAAALDPDYALDARLGEIHFGDWEGRSWNDIDRSALDAWAADVLHFVPPGGESVAQLQARAIDFARSLHSPRVALVTHAGVIRSLMGYWRRLPVEEWTRLQFDFGSLTSLEV